MRKEKDESESPPGAVMTPHRAGGGSTARKASTYMRGINEGKGCHGEHATHMMLSIENFE